MIPISKVDVGDEAERLVLDVLRSGYLAQGKYVSALEDQFAALTGCEHAIALGSGTAALFLALAAAGIGPGDEVITSPFTFVATLNAICAAGATARFADIGEDYAVSAETVAPLVNSRTRAILPVHLYGLPADAPGLARLAGEYGLTLIEDAAQAVGAAVAGRQVGSFGIGCFSLYATKNVTTGEGGMITTDDPDVADRVRLLRNQGMRGRYEYEIAGFNHRLTDIQAAIGIPQMERLDEINTRRRENAAALTAGLEEIPGLRLPEEPPGRHHVFHQYTVELEGEPALDRDAVVDRLATAGVATGVYYPRLVHDYPCFADHPLVVKDPTPRAAAAAARVLSLPVHTGLSDEDVQTVIGETERILT
jgi:dTDP-4-amino-4,6-dideoxygalactose transaminase